MRKEQENDFIDFEDLLSEDEDFGRADRYDDDGYDDDFDDRYDDNYDDHYDDRRNVRNDRYEEDRRDRYDRYDDDFDDRYDDLEDKKPARRRGKKDGSAGTFLFALSHLIPIVLLAVIGVSGYLFLKDFMTYRAAEKEYDSIKELIRIEPNMSSGDKQVKDTADAEETEEGEDYSFPTIEIDFDGLKAINSDFAGVLYIPALDLFYPMAYSYNNSEYLSTTFEGTKNPSGCIFVDCNASREFRDLHTFVFGHNMKNETMFGSLKNFSKDNSLVERSPYFYIFDKDMIRKYEIFAYFTIPVTDSMFDGIPDDSLYESFINSAVSKTMYNPAEAIDFSDHPRLVTLSTCWGTGHQYDFEVMGVLQEVRWND